MSEAGLNEADPGEVFDRHRRFLTAMAYRMVGTVADAEDAVQDTYVRWHAVDRTDIRSPKAWLHTTLTRICIDVLRSARVQREVYVGPWLPEPVLTDSADAPLDPAELAESLSMALLAVLERLSPTERAAFLLRETFDYSYPEIARIIDESEANCRQLVHRAKKRLAQERPRFATTAEEKARLATAFITAASTGEVDPLLQLFADDITLWSDGGGKTRAALRPVIGPLNVARFILGVSGKRPAGFNLEAREINGQPGFVAYIDDDPYLTMSFDVGPGKIHGIYLIINPDKLTRFPSRSAS